MARTKQTAKKSTGQAAPRRSLGSKVEPEAAKNSLGSNVKPEAAKNSLGSNVKPEAAKNSGGKRANQESPSKLSAKRSKVEGPRPPQSPGSPHDDWCSLCQNGGDTIECDLCKRVACKHHFPAIAKLSQEELDPLVFKCTSCEVLEQRKLKGPGAYKGLYKIEDGKEVPYFDGFTQVDAVNLRPLHARVNTAPIAIVHIRLQSLADAGSPARVTYAALQGYYVKNPQDLLYIDAPYAIEDLDDAKRYRKSLDKQLKFLDESNGRGIRLLVFIYTHSEDSSGDLFWKDGLASNDLAEWFREVFPPRLWASGNTADVTLALLSCGALMESEEKRKVVKDVGERMRVQHVVCFGAAALQAPLTVPFFMGFAISVYIENVNLDHSHFTRLLSSASMLNRHTTVVLYTRVAANEPALLLNNYRWSHHTVRPYGEELPLQCPDCSSLASLKIKAGQGDKLHGTCEQKGCGFSRAYALSEGYKVVKAVERGAWLVSVETVGE